MDEKMSLVNTISETLDNIAFICNDNSITKIESDSCFIYKFSLKRPKENSIESFILPKQIDFIVDNNKLKGHVFLIDVFCIENNDFSLITPNDFFDFLINLNGYEEYMKNPNKFLKYPEVEEDNDWENFDKYIYRENIKIFNTTYEQGDEFKNEIDLLDKWLDGEVNENPLLLIGDQGIGKTWFLKKFCHDHFMNKHKDDPWNNPPVIYINLGLLSLNSFYIKDVFEVIKFYLTKYNIDLFDTYNVFYGLLKSKRIILALDGLDEVSLQITNKVLSKNIYDILSLTRYTHYIILSTRSNLFDNYSQLLEFFEHKTFLEQLEINEVQFNPTEDVLRVRFNIWSLGDLKQEEIIELLNLSQKKLKELGLGKVKSNLEKIALKMPDDRTFVEQEISNLYGNSRLADFFVNNTYPNLFYAFEQSIENILFKFNIKQNRALFKDSKLFIDFKNNKVKVLNEIFDKDKKYILIQHLAWSLFISNTESFSLDHIPAQFFRLHPEIVDNEIKINDLKTQTVLTWDEKRNKISFINDSIFYYFVALHIFNLMYSKSRYIDDIKRQNKSISVKEINGIVSENRIAALKAIGSYPFDKGEEYKIIEFLHQKIIRESETNKQSSLKIELLYTAEELIDNRIYLPWNRYLIANLEKLVINTSSIKNKSSWFKYPIDSYSNGIKASSYIERPCFIPSTYFIDKITRESTKLDAFLISSSEITNTQFNDFLNNCNIDDDLRGVYWKRNSEFWRKDVNPFKNVINDYHLLLWPNGNMPDNISDHPVVYISWFAAAQFCNWLSYEENLPPYYNFHFEEIDDGVSGVIKIPYVTVSEKSFGYRLPTIPEWESVILETDFTKLEYKIWDGKSENERNKIVKEFYRENLDIFPVKSSEMNSLGIYGMEHNVREWADWGIIYPERDANVRWKDIKPFLGPTWLLGEDGASLINRHIIMAQNTNIDQGFRIARSLNEDEQKNLKLAKNMK